LGNHKAENDRDMMDDLVQSYKTMKCNTSFKVHFLDFFPGNLGALNNKPEE